MTITATAKPEPQTATHPPRVRIDITATSPTPGGAPVVLTRTHADGRSYRVILETGAHLTAGSWSGFDYLAPFNQPVSYSVVLGATSGNVGSVRYSASGANLFPLDVNHGGPSLMLGWSGGSVASVGTLSLAAGQSATIAGLPAGAGTTYSLGLDVSGDASVSAQFVGSEPLGAPVTTTVVGADRPVVSAAAPAGCASATVTVTAGGSAITVTNPTWVEGATYPAAAAPTASATSDSSVLVLESRHWLQHPTNPLLSMPFSKVQAVGDTTEASSSQTFFPLGAKYPVVVSEGVRRGKAGTLSVAVLSEAELAGLSALLADGGPLMVNIVGDGWRDLRWAWISPGDVQKQNPYGRHLADRMVLSFQYQEIGVPAGYSTPVWTVASLAAAFATVSDAAAAYATVADMAIDARVA